MRTGLRAAEKNARRFAEGFACSLSVLLNTCFEVRRPVRSVYLRAFPPRVRQECGLTLRLNMCNFNYNPISSLINAFAPSGPVRLSRIDFLSPLTVNPKVK